MDNSRAALTATLLFGALFALSACGNKGALVMPPPPSDEDAALEEADAVDNAGAVADPTPVDEDAGVTPFPPAAEPEMVPEAEPAPDIDAETVPEADSGADGEPELDPDPPADGGD